MKDEVIITINVNKSIKEQLKQLAKMTERSVSAVVRLAIVDYLDRQK